jgi:hypothetical protein
MAVDKKISQLDSALSLVGTEYIPIVQPVSNPKGNKKITIDQLMELAPVQTVDIANFIENITGLVTQGSNITITGSGTSVSPYQIAAASIANGNGTTANGMSVDLGGTFSSNVQFLGGGFSFTLGTSGNKISTFNINAVGASSLKSDIGFTLEAPSVFLKDTGSRRIGVGTNNIILDVGSDAVGDIYYRNLSGFLVRLAATSDGQVLTLASGIPSWAAPSGGGGSVTSVGMTVPSIMSVSGSPITGSGTLAVSLTNQNANVIFSGPTNGAAATPTFRSLVAADIPDLSATYYSASNPNGYTSNVGTVTSVALTVPGILSVSGSPISVSGTLAVSLANQNANLVFAGPTNGAAATPTFRALVAADFPDAAADATTKGVATFVAADFTSAAGVIGIDYTNGQAASGSNKGFLTAADWTTFNGKQAGDATLTALAAYNTNGILTQTAADTFVGRTITETAGKTVVTNGSGVAGNPVINIGADVVDKTVTNTYTAGAVQIFTASATNAGLRIAEAAVHSSLVDGDIWHVTNSDLWARINSQSVPLTRPNQTTQTGTTYTLAESDRNSIIYFTNSSTVTVTGANLTTGFSVTLVMAGTGNIVFAPDAGLTLDATDTTISTQYAAATFVKKSSTVWGGFGALGSFAGITNSADADELTKSDGTNIVGTKVFSTTDGNLILGDTGMAGSRTITAVNSGSGASLTVASTGIGALFLTSPSGSVLASGTRMFFDGNLSGAAPTIFSIDNTNLTSEPIKFIIGSGGHVLEGGTVAAHSFTIRGHGSGGSGQHGVEVIVQGGGSGLSGVANGGNVTLRSGAIGGTSTGVDGNITIDTLTGYLIISTIPTSSAGLPSGAVWANSNVLTIVP